jgi:uncharacterized membrane protein YagU involved in acid resistance
MTRAQSAWREAEKTVKPPSARPDQGHPQSQHEKGGSATEKIADAIAEKVVHHKLPPRQRSLGGTLVHYGFGTLTGAVYGMIAEALPKAGAGLGLPFGAALWVAADNVAVPASGLSEPPTKQPPSMLVYGLSTHLVYGFALELTRRLLRKVI